MDSKLFLIIILQVLSSVEGKPSENHDGIRRKQRNNEQDNVYGDILRQLPSKLQNLKSPNWYSKFGSHLEKMSLNCDSENFRKLKTAITDFDQPVQVKLMAIAISSIAVGCKETAVWVGSFLGDVHEKNELDITKQDVMSGPFENPTMPCNFEIAEYMRNSLKSSKLTYLYYILSSSLFLTLGCHELGKNSLQNLYHDLNINNTMQTSADRNMLGKGVNRGIFHLRNTELIMNYIYQHKSDIQKYQQVELLVDDTNLVTLSENYKNGNARKRRNAGNQNIPQYFSLKRGCSIESPLGITLISVSKSTCLQFCFDQDGCRSVGYKNDNSQQCQLNTEVEKEVGQFFSCAESDTTEYYEKKKESKKLLTHPRLTLKQEWKAALNSIENLERFRKRMEELRQVSKAEGTHIRCRRTPTSLLCCCFAPERPQLGYTNKQRTRFEQLLSGNTQPVTISVCARRYMTLQADSLKIRRPRIDNILSGLQTEVEKAEVYAIFKFTDGSINKILHQISEGLPIDSTLTKKDVDSIFYQASLMQYYLKRNPMNQRVPVYRFEKNVMAGLYRENEIYIPKQFMSTTKINGRFSTGIPLNNKRLYPVELEINLKNSGTDISSLSAYPSQQEVLLPVGVKLRVRKKEEITEDGINIIRVALDEI